MFAQENEVEDDPDFYLRREQEERTRAAEAIDPRIATIHMEMAAAYTELARMPAEGSRTKAFRPAS